MIRRFFGNPVYQTALLLSIVFMIQISISSQQVYEELFVLTTPLETHPWTIFTNIYSHAHLGHFSSNLIALLLFGLPISRFTSTLRFHSFFIVTGVIAGVSQVLTIYYLNEFGLIALESIPGVLGASGAIFGLMGYLIVSNSASVFISSYFNFSRLYKYGFYFLLAFIITIATASPGAALIAHFVGFLLGIIAGRRKLLKK